MALNDRKGGMVARIRVSPKDCLAVLDVMERVGLDPLQHSFSGCVAIALSSLIGVARRASIIPMEEDGFQYLNRMEPFMGQVSTRTKRELTNRLYEGAQRGLSAPSLMDSRPQERTKAGVSVSPLPVALDPSLREKYKEEYQALVSIVRDGGEDVTEEMLERFSYLQGLLF